VIGDTRPTSPSDFFSASGHSPPYTITTGDSSIYDWICEIDDVSWRHTDSTPALEFGADSELYIIKVYQDRDSVTKLTVTWRGKGSQGDLTYHTRVQIYDYVDDSWLTLEDRTSSTGSKTLATYVNEITTNVKNYIEAGSGNVSIFVSADTNSIPSTQGIYTDYIELEIE
jgi:hypothetical protein